MSWSHHTAECWSIVPPVNGPDLDHRMRWLRPPDGDMVIGFLNWNQCVGIDYWSFLGPRSTENLLPESCRSWNRPSSDDLQRLGWRFGPPVLGPEETLLLYNRAGLGRWEVPA
jgi:hypothetical protein